MRNVGSYVSHSFVVIHIHCSSLTLVIEFEYKRELNHKCNRQGEIMKIEIKSVSKRFGNKQILKDINLVANSGEILCILGPSGAGKTTLIRLITGSIMADSGEIIIDGKKQPNMNSIKDIGFMPQSEAIYDDISGLDNLLFFGRLFGLRGKSLRERADRTLDMVNLKEDKDKLVANYSGGMKKRLSLAITLIHEPSILILDEPTVGIDPVLRKSIWNEFEDLRKLGRTIIVSTHVMDEAERCQKAALIYGGILIESDEVEKLKEKTHSGSLEELFFTAEKAGAQI